MMAKLKILLVVFPPLFLCGSMVASEFSGAVGRWKAAYSLNWKENGEVEGTYHYPGKRKTVYTLKGRSSSADELYLEEYTGRKLSARCFLTKTATDTMIIWKGKMNNTDGRKFDMTISRAKTAEERSPKKMREEEETKLREFEKKKFTTTSDFYSYAHNLAVFEKCRSYRAVVSSVDENTGGSGEVILFKIKKDVTGNSAVPSFTLKNQMARFVWEERHGPAPFSKNVDAVIDVNAEGEVIKASVWIVPVKWRKSHSGDVEFLLWGISDTGDKVLGKSAFTGQALKAASKPIILRPVKFEHFSAETYFIALKGVGAVIAVFEAGPGNVELESISLEVEEVAERPWIDIPESGEFPEPSTSQFIASGNY